MSEWDRSRVSWVLGILAFFANVGVFDSLTPRAAGQNDAEFFEAKVRPILVEHCRSCHGELKSKGGLRLTDRMAMLTGGASGPAVVPGKPEESLLVQAVRYDSEPRMPPRARLSETEIATLTRWVAMGAPWPEARQEPVRNASPAESKAVFTEEQRRFWSFQPLGESPAPPVQDECWIQTPLDRFILARLEAKGLKPSPPADRRVLIRRATFDLIGLPPTPDEVEAFVNDPDPDAFTKVVDRLLNNPGYGERWARYWLDVVRYADSLDSRGSGQPGDILDAWRYRDWVVEAWNRDLPYDQFVREQIAGDLLPPTSGDDGSEGFNKSGTIATTMLAIGNWGNGDADKDKILTDIADDQIDVVSRAFLGLTISCARCHDHKFDPISQEDYYGLAGIFFSTHILPKLTPKGAGETIIRVPLASSAELARRAAREKRIETLEKDLAEARSRHYAAFARGMISQAGRYLMAAWEYQTSGRTDPETFARDRGLHAFALRRWLDFLGGPPSQSLTNRVQNVGGKAGVLAWNLTPGASATANTTDDVLKILTFTLPARSLSVHPGPQSHAVVSWRSPIAGPVRVTGRIADNDNACGDGVRWALVHRSSYGAEPIASGEIPNGGAMALGQGQSSDRLSMIKVRPGDRLDLVVQRKGDYGCDTTTVDLVISEWNGSSTWDVTRDCLNDFHAKNPHPDRLGHDDVWSFGDSPSIQVEPTPELLAWYKAAREGTDRTQLEPIAETVGTAIASNETQSPFFIRDPADEAVLSTEARAEIARLNTSLAQLKSNPPAPLEYANAAQEGGVPESPHAGVHDVRVHLRGRYDRLGNLVPRSFPTILTGGVRQPLATNGSGRRELALWLTRSENPLTARVIVNRIWQYHFGEGIVRTPSNFGRLGERPSHPELLDFLARTLIRDSWSLKAIHRQIMLSSVYQQSSTPSPELLKHDPDNHLFGRMNRRRLDAEAIRDNMLAVSGRLDRTSGGPSVRDPAQPRRTLYITTIRSDRATVGALFDQADSTAPVDRRTVSTVAPQALYFLNNTFVIEQARALASRLRLQENDQRQRIAAAYRLLLARPPRTEEVDISETFLKESQRNGDSNESAWIQLCQIWLCTNEFLYVD